MPDPVDEEAACAGSVRLHCGDGEDLHGVAGSATLRTRKLLPRRGVLVEVELTKKLAEVGSSRAHDPLLEQRKQPCCQVGLIPVREAQEWQETLHCGRTPQVPVPVAGPVLEQTNRRDQPAGRMLPGDDQASRGAPDVPVGNRGPGPDGRRFRQRSRSSLLRLTSSSSRTNVAARSDSLGVRATIASMSACRTAASRSNQ